MGLKSFRFCLSIQCNVFQSTNLSLVIHKRIPFTYKYMYCIYLLLYVLAFKFVYVTYSIVLSVYGTCGHGPLFVVGSYVCPKTLK